MTVLTSKGKYIWGLSRATATAILKEPLVGFIHIYHLDILNKALLSHSYVFETGSYCGNSGQNVHSKDRGGDESESVSGSVMSDSLRPHEWQHARPPCPSVYLNSCPLSRWCHPAISSSVVPFSSCPQSLPASGSFPMSQLFAWGGQSIGVSASASGLEKPFLPVRAQLRVMLLNIQKSFMTPQSPGLVW